MAVQPETLDLYDDRQLVAAFQAGEGGAFERIVGAHYASLLAEARRKLRSASDAEDAVQETLLRARTWRSTASVGSTGFVRG